MMTFDDIFQLTLDQLSCLQSLYDKLEVYHDIAVRNLSEVDFENYMIQCEKWDKENAKQNDPTA